MVAAELPHGLVGQRPGAQGVEVLPGHLHGRHDVRPGADGHLDALLVDEVGVLEAAGAGADRLLARLGRAGVHGDGHAQQPRGGAQGLHLVVEPGHPGGIVAGAEVAAGVGGLDPVGPVGVLAADQPPDLRDAVGDRGDRQVPARGVEPAQVAVAGGGAEDVPGDHQPGPLDQPGVQGVAQVDGRELRVHGAQVAQRREAVPQVLLRQAEAGQRLGRRGRQRLPGQVGRVHRQVHVGVDEPRADRALGQVDHLAPRPGGSPPARSRR